MSDESSKTEAGATESPDADAPAALPDHDEPIPRLPRGKGFSLSSPTIFRIFMFGALLFGVIALRQPCADGISNFMNTFEDVDAAVEEPADKPAPPGDFVRITGDMSEEEIRKKLNQAGLEDSQATNPDAGVPDASPSGGP